MALSNGSANCYMAPFTNGAIANNATNLRMYYGAGLNGALWQMMDLFSTSRGGGVYVRSTNEGRSI